MISDEFSETFANSVQSDKPSAEHSGPNPFSNNKKIIIELTPEEVDELKKLIKESEEPLRCDDEDFVPYDWFGGNMDDAYYGGLRDGERLGVAAIVKLLKIKL